MNVRLAITLNVLLLISCQIKSQVTDVRKTKNIIYAEAFGIGGFGSINYEHILFSKPRLDFAIRIGLSTHNIKDYTDQFNPEIILPLGVQFLYGNQHNLELGVGQTIAQMIQPNSSTWNPKRVTTIHSNFTLGYRYQKDHGGIVLRINYSPLIEFNNRYRHWGGISIGYGF